MVAYNFQKQFVPKILSREKLQTIRATGKRRHASKGDVIQLYTGQRTKDCRLLFESICCQSQEIVMSLNSDEALDIRIDGHLLSIREMEALAIVDGFEDLNGLIRFFQETHGFPFEGRLIGWQPEAHKRGDCNG